MDDNKRKRQRWARGLVGGFIGLAAGATIFPLLLLLYILGRRMYDQLPLLPDMMSLLSWTPLYTLIVGVLIALGVVRRPRYQFMLVGLPIGVLAFTFALLKVPDLQRALAPPATLPVPLTIASQDTLAPLPYAGEIIGSRDDTFQLFRYNLRTGTRTFYDAYGIDPSWSPDGTRAVFRMDNELESPYAIADFAASQMAQLPRLEYASRMADWSADGTSILIDDDYSMAVFNLNTQTSQRFRLFAWGLLSPRFRPQARQIAAIWRVGGEDDTGQVFLVDLDCLSAERCEGRQITSLDSTMDWLDWHPDGTQLVVGGWLFDDPICIQALDETEARCVAEGRSPRWSPDGEQLLYSAHDPQTGRDQLYLHHLKSGTVEMIPFDFSVRSFDWR